jgi:hypothetical protein
MLSGPSRATAFPPDSLSRGRVSADAERRADGPLAFACTCSCQVRLLFGACDQRLHVHTNMNLEICVSERTTRDHSSIDLLTLDSKLPILSRIVRHIRRNRASVRLHSCSSSRLQYWPVIPFHSRDYNFQSWQAILMAMCQKPKIIKGCYAHFDLSSIPVRPFDHRDLTPGYIQSAICILDKH